MPTSTSTTWPGPRSAGSPTAPITRATRSGRLDGTRIAFASSAAWCPDVLETVGRSPRRTRGARTGQRADEPLAPGIYARIPHAWTMDRKYLAFTENHPDTRRDIWILPVAPAGKPYPIVTTPFEDSQPVFSPNGKWLATSERAGDERSTPALQAARRTAFHVRRHRAAIGEEMVSCLWHGDTMMSVRSPPPGTPCGLAPHERCSSSNTGARTASLRTGSDSSCFGQHAPQSPKNLVLVHQWPAEIRRSMTAQSPPARSRHTRRPGPRSELTSSDERLSARIPSDALAIGFVPRAARRGKMGHGVVDALSGTQSASPFGTSRLLSPPYGCASPAPDTTRERS